MGAQFSKNAANRETVAEKAGEAAAGSPTKTNGQVCIHFAIDLDIPWIILMQWVRGMRGFQPVTRNVGGSL